MTVEAAVLDQTLRVEFGDFARFSLPSEAELQEDAEMLRISEASATAQTDVVAKFPVVSPGKNLLCFSPCIMRDSNRCYFFSIIISFFCTNCDVEMRLPAVSTDTQKDPEVTAVPEVRVSGFESRVDPTRTAQGVRC